MDQPYSVIRAEIPFGQIIKISLKVRAKSSAVNKRTIQAQGA